MCTVLAMPQSRSETQVQGDPADNYSDNAEDQDVQKKKCRRPASTWYHQSRTYAAREYRAVQVLELVLMMAPYRYRIPTTAFESMAVSGCSKRCLLRLQKSVLKRCSQTDIDTKDRHSALPYNRNHLRADRRVAAVC